MQEIRPVITCPKMLKSGPFVALGNKKTPSHIFVTKDESKEIAYKLNRPKTTKVIRWFIKRML